MCERMKLTTTVIKLRKIVKWTKTREGCCVGMGTTVGEGPSRDMDKGHMDKAKVGRFRGGRRGWVGQGAEVGGKWRQLYLNNNKKIYKYHGWCGSVD